MESARATAEVLDSRTAAFTGKRNHDDASKSSTPRKRLRRGKQRALYDVQDFVPNGGAFTAINLKAKGRRESGFTPAVSVDGSESSDPVTHSVQSPKFTEERTKPRPTTRKRRPGHDSKLPEINFDVPVAEEPSQIPSFRDIIPPGTSFWLSEKLAVRENKEYFKCFSIAFGHLLAARERLHDVSSKNLTAEKALHQAKIAFAWCQYWPLEQKWRPFPKPKGLRRSSSKPPGALRHFWDVVEKSMLDGTLLDLRAGKLGAVQDYMGNSVQLRLSGEVNDADEHVDPENGDSNSDVSSRDQRNRSASISESTRKVITNIGLDGANEGSNWTKFRESDERHHTDSSDSSDSDEYVGRYADSKQPVRRHDTQHSSRSGTVHNPRVLADLSPKDLNAQLRYFHFSKGMKNLPLDAEVRCLACSRPGHMAAECELLTCSTCGAHNKHTTANCQTNVKCAKCRETGHNESICPYKLKKLARHEMDCSLCKQQGHLENECELFWRTSGSPWKSDLSNRNIRLFCYECGGSGHLGNDCSTRQPGKSMGTSTWSTRQSGPTHSTHDEMNIRGHARQSRPSYSQPNDDSEPANFYRPKAPDPSRKGQIKINVKNSQTVNTFPTPAWTTTNGSGGTDRRAPPNYDSPRFNGRALSNNHWSDRKGQPTQSYQRSSYHPQYQGPPGTDDPYKYRPPPPPPQLGRYRVQLPSKPPDIYRPMPSAAHNAWNRQRY